MVRAYLQVASIAIVKTVRGKEVSEREVESEGEVQES